MNFSRTWICIVLFPMVLSLYVKADNSEFQDFKVDPSIKLPTAPKDAQEAWKDARFGMFIHWGPISQMGTQLSHSRNSPSHRTGGKPYKVAPIPPEVYDAQYKTFNPVKFDPDAIVKMAKNAGVSHIVFTAKHHAGFSMFDSAYTDYDIMSAPYKKDIVKMLSDACSKNGVKFGFYYSPRDWHHPDCDSDKHHDRYITFFKHQMQELLTKYGPIYEIWFDGLGPGEWGNTSKEVMSAIRKLQPNAMVNDRGGAGADFYTPEQSISFFNNEQCWETCLTTTGQWGYNPKVHAKPLPLLMEMLLYTWGSDGNILLNIGPMGDGTVNPEEKERFEQLAKWWEVNGEESIRGTRGGPYLPGPWGVSTRKGNKVFLHIFRWPPAGGLTFPTLEGLKVKQARLLNGGKIDLTSTPKTFTVSVSAEDRDKIVTTAELIFDGDTGSVKPLYRVPSLTASAELTSSAGDKDLKNLVDQNARTSWMLKPPKNVKTSWIEARFDKPVTIGSFTLQQGHSGTIATLPALQIPDGSGGWKTVSSKKMKLKFDTIKFLPEPVTTDRVRLLLTGTKKIDCAEFELFPPVESSLSK